MIGYNNIKNNTSAGFTLIEMVVVIGIFSVVLLIIAGMVTQFTSTQRRNIAEQALQSDLRAALELLNREIRTGYGTTFTAISGFDDALTFRNQNGDCVQYRFTRGGALERAAVERDSISDDVACTNPTYGEFTTLTSDETHINRDFSGFMPKRAEVNANQVLTSQGFVEIQIFAETDNASVPPVELKSTITARQVIAFPPPDLD